MYVRYSGDWGGVVIIMYGCRCVLGVQLGGRCCWHGQWMYPVHVTGSVVGLAGFCCIIFIFWVFFLICFGVGFFFWGGGGVSVCSI